jgi:hypothetical protein
MGHVNTAPNLFSTSFELGIHTMEYVGLFQYTTIKSLN